MALFYCAINENCCSVDGGRGIYPLFWSPPRGIWELKSPHPREIAIQGKKNANARGSARRGWAQVELTDALVQNKIILQSETLNLFQNKPCNLFIPFPKYQYHEVIMKSVWYLHSFPIPMLYFHISGYSPWTSDNSNSRWFERFSISLEGSSYWQSTVDANEQLHLLGGLNVVVFSKIIINKQQTFNELMLQLKTVSYTHLTLPTSDLV